MDTNLNFRMLELRGLVYVNIHWVMNNLKYVTYPPAPVPATADMVTLF